MKFQERAYAKLNLNLEVLGKRADGFHNIYSIMACTEFCDTMSLSHCDLSSGGELEVKIIAKPSEFAFILEGVPGDKNLITIAARHYLGELGYGGELVFEVEKNIPAGGGLGGGSSDAATALKILANYLGRGIDQYSFRAAKATGSDVPFFLMNSAALAESRGDILTPIEFFCPHHILLVNPGISVDTGMAYRSLGLTSGAPALPLRSLREELNSVLNDPAEWKGRFINDFQRPIFEKFPVIWEIVDEIYDGGALFSLMTGSGSSVFGVFEDISAAMELRNSFMAKNYWSVITKLL